MLLSIGTVLFFCTTFYYRSNANYHSEQTKVLERKLHKVEGHSRKLQNHVEHHENYSQNLVEEHTAQKDLMWHDHEVDEHVDEKLTVLWDRVDDLREHVQSFSRRSVLDRFGPGPHQVTMDIEMEAGDVHTAGGGQETHYYTKTVTFELAPLDLMPHTIHMFLEQVVRGLWDGTSFVINGPHVAQVSPFTESDESVRHRFKDVNLHGLSFQEYSAEYPHVQYTLGITGRPGGPDFYINKKDNTELHGPYGQEGDMEEEADPCFGRVVSGFETLDHVFEQPASDKESGHYLDNYIEVVRMRIIGQQPPAPGLTQPTHWKPNVPRDHNIHVHNEEHEATHKAEETHHQNTHGGHVHGGHVHGGHEPSSDPHHHNHHETQKASSMHHYHAGTHHS